MTRVSAPPKPGATLPLTRSPVGRNLTDNLLDYG